jgi:predicted small lipoprotein YifL
MLRRFGVLSKGSRLARHCRYRPRAAAALAVAIAAALALTGCGRKGGLDLPPSDVAPAPTPSASNAPPGSGLSPSSFIPGGSQSAASTAAPGAQDAARRNGFDSKGNPIAGQPMAKGFILDPLLQ